MKKRIMDKPGRFKNAVSITVTVVMFCALAVLIIPEGGVVSASMPNSLSGISGRYMRELSDENGLGKVNVFNSENVVLYFSERNYRGSPMYCLDASKTGPVSSTNYSKRTAESIFSNATTRNGVYALLLNGYPYKDGGLNRYQAQGYTQRVLWLWLSERGTGGSQSSTNSKINSIRNSTEKAYCQSMINAARSQSVPNITVSPTTINMHENSTGTGFTGTTTLSFVDLNGQCRIDDTKLPSGVSVSVSSGSLTNVSNGATLTFTTTDTSRSDTRISIADLIIGTDSRTVDNLFFYNPSNSSYQRMVGCVKTTPLNDVVKKTVTLTFPETGGYFRLVKTDDTDSQINVSATFDLYRMNGATEEFVRQINLTGGAYSSATHGLLEYGDYKLYETVPPAGYIASAVPQTFTITPAHRSPTAPLVVRYANTPDTPVSGSETIRGKKTVTVYPNGYGDGTAPNYHFTFTAKQWTDIGTDIISGEEIVDGITGIGSVYGEGSFTITFTGLVVGETYYFKVTEDNDYTDKRVGEWVYDKTVFWVKIVVGDSITYYDEDGDPITEIEFENEYTAPPPSRVPVTITADKTISGQDPAKAMPVFSFRLTQLNSPDPEDVMVSGISVDSTVTGEGDIVFNVTPGLGEGEYYFKIEEISTVSARDWAYDVQTRVVTVSVISNADDSLSVFTEYTVGSSTFENHYTPTTSWQVEFEKAIEGAGAPAGTEFTYTLTQLNSVNVDDESEDFTPLTLTKAGQGTFKFPAIDGLYPGEYYFRLEETTGGVSPPWTNDNEPRIIIVTVTDNGNGTATATQEYLDTGVPDIITNTYSPQMTPGSIIITGTKAVSGSGAPNVTFHFSLTQLNSANVNDIKSGGITRTTSRTGGGTFTFPEITGLTAGEYFFMVRETMGGPTPPWTNDTEPRIVKVTVSGSGSSLASVFEYISGIRTFTNRYEPGGGGPPPPTPPTPSPSPSGTPSSSPSPSPSPSPSESPPVFTPSTYSPPPPDFEPEPAPPEPAPPSSTEPWIEFDENGTPLGEWRWDPETETWIFDPFPPLADLPQTGTVNLHAVLFPFGLGTVGTGMLIRRLKARKREWPEFF